MHISRIFIRNFRNFRHLDVPICDGVTCFIGENNSGKTNLFYALRLVLDGTISSARRCLQEDEVSVGLTFKKPEHVLISIEFSDFADQPEQEALICEAVLESGVARLSYRFRPRAVVRDEIAQWGDGKPARELNLDDYHWELVGGGDDIDLSTISWSDNFGSYFRSETLQQGYLVVLMEALRDVESRLAQQRGSPLQQLIDQKGFPAEEQTGLVDLLKDANKQINDSESIKDLANEITASFGEAAGKTYSMSVSLGLGTPTFTDITRGIKVLLSGYGLDNIDPSRNGLGLNNVLFISMILRYFEQRRVDAKMAGQLLLIEEPEAHLHPQLQRVLVSMLLNKSVQVFVTSHSTHVTSAIPLERQVVLTSTGSAATGSVRVAQIPGIDEKIGADLERYLDATRSTLLYARRVMLVEGPAEQFLIPPLVKQVMGIDLEDLGISVVPIYGTHFSVYAKLFGPEGIQKKCAVVADGDLVPSDAVDTEDAESDVDVSTLRQLNVEENDLVKVFQSTSTFEREIATSGNFHMLEWAAYEVQAASLQKLLKELQEAIAREEANLPTDQIGTRVLNLAKRIGKARFAQITARHTKHANDIPEYVSKAVEWLTG